MGERKVGKRIRHITPLASFGPTEEDGTGVYSLMLSPKRMNKYIGDLDSVYDRKNLGLKIFVGNPKPLKEFLWGGDSPCYGRPSAGNSLYDCARIMNLAALYDLAPRVYDIVLIPFRGKDRYAFVTDYLEGRFGGNENNKIINNIRKELAKYGVKIGGGGIDNSPDNFINGKLVDWQMFKLDDKKFKEYVKKQADEATNWGSKDFSYQDVEELKIEGQRNTKRRIKVLGLDKVDFEGKTVLDIGCSTGSFCRYSARNGAARVIGTDIKGVPKAAAEISYYLGDFNIDFEDVRLWDEVDKLGSYDIVFFLSVAQQVGYESEYIKKLCKDYFFLEGHSADKEETYRPLLEKDFKSVKFVGTMKNSARPAFVCRKNTLKL